MVHGWDNAEALSNRILEAGGIYVRLANDGDKVVGVFCGEPFARTVHWTGAAYEECTGDACAPCASGSKASLRVACNFYVLADRTMKIVEGGTRWFSDVLKIRKKYGVSDWAFEIERHGAANSPKTTYAILPDIRLDSAQKSLAATAKLHDLAATATGAAREAFEVGEITAPAPAAETSGTAVPLDVARELHDQLKALAKADVAAFFAKFGVERVSQLKAADLDEARAFLARLADDLPF
jgi:hypothetical protein